MDRLESVKFEIGSNSVKKTEVTPQNAGRIKGIMMHPRFKKDDTNIEISVMTAGGVSIIDRVDIAHLIDREVSWGQNYIPVDVPSQRLYITAYTGQTTVTEKTIELVLIHEAINNRC